ncbi:MAG: type II toxin-antitoxin system ParD family antitoxin [Planctomycetes bacterium]|nr:type II toxin-antitoxin system ParD family antitoxin [Planctomycetota bacterium]
MNISLTPAQQNLITEQIESGRFQSPTEVIGAALCLFEERERARQEQLDRIRKEIAVGLDDIARGDIEPLDMEAIIVKANQRLAQRAERT